MPDKQPYAIVLADAHLDGWNTELDVFLAFLQRLAASPIHAVYLLGDICNLWLGAPKFTLAYQQAIREVLQYIRAQGKSVVYVEGNRDYFLAPHYTPTPFEVIATEYVRERIGTRHVYLAHGDLVNVQDQQYRRWRSLSRNQTVYALFNSLPRWFALRFAQYLEATFRATNRKHKARFPEEICTSFAQTRFEAGDDTVIVGHFHEKRHYAFDTNSVRKMLYVLPAWKDGHEYLEIDSSGAACFRGIDSST